MTCLSATCEPRTMQPFGSRAGESSVLTLYVPYVYSETVTLGHFYKRQHFGNLKNILIHICTQHLDFEELYSFTKKKINIKDKRITEPKYIELLYCDDNISHIDIQ